MNRYYITFEISQNYTAWYKSIADSEYFLNSMGFRPIPLTNRTDHMESCLSDAFGREQSGMVVVQFPRAKFHGLDFNRFTEFMKKNYPGFKLVAIIHDLDSIRFGNFFTTHVLEETPILNRFDYLVSINDAMTSLLKEQNVTSKIFSIDLFDYELKQRPESISSEPTVAFAGNLQPGKSTFLYDLHKMDLKNVKIDLYGPYLDQKKFIASANVAYRGYFAPDELASKIHDKFGLCWEGDALDRCAGKFSRYMKYGNPHKTSLYLALGIPVIISKDIGAAAYVEKEHAGILIDSLYEIPERLNRMSASEYQLLRQNCLKVSDRLRSGYHLRRVIGQIESDIRSNT